MGKYCILIKILYFSYEYQLYIRKIIKLNIFKYIVGNKVLGKQLLRLF